MATAAKKTSQKKIFDLVRVSSEDKHYLQTRAKAIGTSMAGYIQKLIIQDQHRIWFEKAADAERILRQDSNAWSFEAKERQLWDSTLQDIPE